MVEKSNTWFVKLFDDLEKGLRIYCDVDEADFKKKMSQKYFLQDEFFQSDNEIFRVIVKAIFFSGVKAEQIEKHMPAIKKELFDFQRVVNYSTSEKMEIKRPGGRVGYSQKSEAVFHAAEMILKIKQEYGSFANYLKKEHEITDYNPKLGQLKGFLDDLIIRFDRVQLITALHIATMLGFNTIKPDIVITRLFTRLGLINQKGTKLSESDIWEIVRLGQIFVGATGYPASRIDNILVKYGAMGETELFGFKILDGICREAKPKCESCLVVDRCSYSLS